MIFFRRKHYLKNIIPSGYTDIHSHILPGIDDGARTLDDSINLIKKFIELGIYKIITTPHVMGGVWQNSSSLILDKLKKVKKELMTQGITEFSLECAAEYMLDENFNELLEKNDLLPIFKNKILVEMSYLSAPYNLYDTMFKIKVKGYEPLLAHPERYNFYHNTSKFSDLKRLGVLFQLNLLSLTNYYGKSVQKVALNLLERNMYNFIGTDAHNLNHLENISFCFLLKATIYIKRFDG